MKKIIISNQYSVFCDELTKQGYSLLYSDTIKTLATPEEKHTDMQVLKIKDTYFVIQEAKRIIQSLKSNKLIICNKRIEKEYPNNILINCLYLNNNLYGKINYCDKNLLWFCKNNNIVINNVNQGYCKCSTAIVNDKAVITADKSISAKLKSNGVDVLKISPGNIILDGYDYGFIGGASGKINNDTLAFFGNISKHPDYKKIKSFCDFYNTDIISLCENMPLTDIGGIVVID